MQLALTCTSFYALQQLLFAFLLFFFFLVAVIRKREALTTVNLLKSLLFPCSAIVFQSTALPSPEAQAEVNVLDCS